MTRIFTTLAAADTLALLAAFTVGWWSKLSHGPGGDGGISIYLLHLLLGLFAALTTLFVHCLIFIYFLGTGRWVKEVALAYDLPDEPFYRVTRVLKRQTFPAALGAMVVTMLTAAAGQGVQVLGWPWVVHFGLALVTLAVNGLVFVVEYRNLLRNAATLDSVLREVDRIRAERGLPPNAEALLEEAEG
jgi:hypothetical protein